MPIVLKSGVVATLGEFGDFEQFTGGERDAQINDYYPAGALTPEKLLGPRTIGDITLVRAYDPTRDAPCVAWAERFQDGLENPRPVTIVRKNQQGVIVDSMIYSICKPKTIRYPEGKAGDGTPGELTIVLSVQNTL